MAQPTSASPLNSPSHAMLHNFHVNVKMFGAVGNGVTNDTAAIQAAIDVAQADGGHGFVYFPPGNYQLGSKLTLEGHGVRLSGAMANVIAEAGSPGVNLSANFTGPMIERTTSATSATVVIEDLTLNNFHATGQGISLSGIEAPSGVYRCNLKTQYGIYFGTNAFSATVASCNITRGLGSIAGSVGIRLAGHGHVIATDVSQQGTGILVEGRGCSITGGRYETNQLSIKVTGAGAASIIGFTMEANDTGIQLAGSAANLIAMGTIQGTVGSPAGGSLVGITIGDEASCTVMSVSELGSHATAFIQSTAGLDQTKATTFIGVTSVTGWSFAQLESGHQILNCSGVTNVIRAPVIASASLPAAGTTQNGRVVIEDNGTGDRNLIIYAGGQRFRIDGGSAF